MFICALAYSTSRCYEVQSQSPLAPLRKGGTKKEVYCITAGSAVSMSDVSFRRAYILRMKLYTAASHVEEHARISTKKILQRKFYKEIYPKKSIQIKVIQIKLYK